MTRGGRITRVKIRPDARRPVRPVCQRTFANCQSRETAGIGLRMDETREQLLQHRIELYRSTLRAGVKGHIAIGYLRQIEDDETELAQIRHAEYTELTARGLAGDDRPLRSLSHYVAELVDRFSHLPITDPRRAGLARRIRRIETEIARRRHDMAADPGRATTTKSASLVS